MQVFNTLTRQKDVFEPGTGGMVRIYVCGVTPYGLCHVGNARPYVVWDVFRRYLEYRGYRVLHVQNFTDVDDKIIDRARAEGLAPGEVSQRYIDQYFADLDALGVRRAHLYPRVTDHIPNIIDMVEGLVERGHAYQVDGDVYFRVESFPAYGKLSGRHLDDLLAGARVEVDPRKSHPMDFALWKAVDEDWAWDSPWGKGRPGWHIECSVMAHRYLGCGFEFHGGGVDLVFPHHENEIAQSEAFTGEPFARYWVHNGFVNFSGEKMAKSVGNVVPIREALEQVSGMALRLFLLSTHYRSPIDFDLEQAQAAETGWERLRNCWENVQAVLGAWECLPAPPETLSLPPREAEMVQAAESSRQRFVEAMDDDFNTARGVGVIFELVRDLNSMLQQPGPYPEWPSALGRGLQVLEELSSCLGLSLSAARVQTAGAEEGLLELLLSVRQQARDSKDFASADAIREGLAELGFLLEDTPQGTRWRRRS